jgi:predicted HicB family RNase H-like nuclease
VVIQKEPGMGARGTESSNILEYKGYIGRVDFDSEADIFHGEVINLRDVIPFQGECVSDLRQAFIDSVEDYLAFCAERGESPEKPFSGHFVVRIDPQLHREIYVRAKKADVSLNRFVQDALEKMLT